MAEGYSELRNERVTAGNGVDYTCRDTGGAQDGVPLVLLQHFRSSLDNWAPGADRRARAGPAGSDVRQRRGRRLPGNHP
jgi:hypothetical protein